MKSVNFVFSIILITLSTYSYTQPIRDLKFENFEPEWIHYSHSKDLSNDIQGYVFQSNPIIEDGHIILLHNIFDKYFQGYLLEKVSLNNGTTKWEQHYNSEKRNERMYAYDVLKEDGDLTMLVFKENQRMLTNIIDPLWTISNLNIFEFDDNDGSLKKENITDPLDSLNKTLLMPFHIYFPNTFKSHLFKLGDNIHYLYRTAFGPDLVCKDYLLDTTGRIIDSIDIERSYNAKIRYLQTKRYLDDKYFDFIYANDGDGTLPQAVLTYFDGFGHEEKELDISPYFKDSDHVTIISYSTDYILFALYTYNDDEEITTERFIRVSHTGQIMEDISSDLLQYNYSNGKMASAYIPQLDKSVCAITNKNSDLLGGYTLTLFLTDGKGNIQSTKKLKLESRPDIISIDNIFPLNESLFLANLIYVVNGLEQKWSTWILFDMDKLGLTVSTHDYNDNTVFIYPNPTTGIVAIDHLDTPSKVDIYDLNGSLVQSVYNVTSEVNIDKLPSGIYILNIMNHQINERHKIIKIK